MTQRTQFSIVKPWDGGLNTSLDASLVQPSDLTIAENVVFSTNGSRQSRGGFQFFDYIGIGTQRKSTGTTRTVIVTLNSGFTISVGNTISVHRGGSTDTNYDIKSATVTAVDSSTYSPAVAISYAGVTSFTEALTADTNTRLGLYTSEKIIGLKDFWYFNGTAKTQLRLAVGSAGTFYKLTSSGSKTKLIIDAGVILTTPLASCSFAVLGEKLYIAFSGSGNKPAYWDGGTTILPVKNHSFDGTDVNTTNPVPDIEHLREHQSRIYATDKTNPDRLHYSDIANGQRWNGEGDSGALDLPGGDGDVSGLSAIFPSFKGRLITTKEKQQYQLVGDLPLTAILPISKGIGSISHLSAVALDQDDILYASVKGFHSLSATDAFGDFAGTFISKNIQPDFNALDAAGLAGIAGVYLPSLNSVAWAVKESGQASNNAFYMLNITEDAESADVRANHKHKWYKWVFTDSQICPVSVEIFRESSVDVLGIGTHQCRIMRYSPTATVDLIDTPITMRVKSGILYVDGNPNIVKGYKRVGILYKTARTETMFNLGFKIDNFHTQVFPISQSPTSDLLGTTFILGSSVLGIKEVLLPDNVSVDGYGYGCTIEITSDTAISIYGFTIEYELAGDQQEVIRE